MRWPWQPEPGMVRVNHRKLIELQRGALRAAELEASIARDTAKAAALGAEVAASRLLADLQVVDVDVELPVTADGRLHEEAFRALVEARVWAKRERQLADVLSGGA